MELNFKKINPQNVRQSLCKFFMCLNFMITSSIAIANPVGGTVTSGSAVITQSPQLTEIHQSTNRAVVDWHSFNIQAGETTKFIQPNSSSTTLNRINSNQGASQIYGKLSANGNIILVNQAGIFFGPGAQVDVASLVATTSNISNIDFMAGNYNFTEGSFTNSSIINKGTLIAANNGLIALIGNNVSNDGIIKAHLGNVVLASGETFTLDLTGNKLIHFGLESTTPESSTDLNEQSIQNNISNSGSITANGGTIYISAKTASNVIDSAINMTGVLEANSVENNNGTIILNGADYINIEGTLSTTGHGIGENGGSIDVRGKNITTSSSAILDASGDINGGSIILFGDSTWAAGTYLATAQTGTGGFIETSGHYLDVSGIVVSTASNSGQYGTWLLDPADISINNSATTDITLSSNTYSPDSGVSTSNILASELLTQLANNNITIETVNNGTDGGGNGDIAIEAALSWTAATTLTLQADRNIYINADITAVNGGLTLSAINGSQSITAGTIGSGTIGGTVGTQTANINVKDFTLSSGQWFQRATSLPTFNVTGNFSIASGSTYNSSFDAQFARIDTTSGNGINDIFGLQGIATGPLSTSYVINNDISANVTSGWNSGSGFVPIGNNSSNFTGSLDGNLNTISNLFIDRDSTTYVGLIGIANGATITNIILKFPTVTGYDRVGSIAGQIDSSSTVTNSAGIDVNITGDVGDTGGLIGYVNTNSSVSTSFTTGQVTTLFSAGGLVGTLRSGGSVANSYSIAKVITTGSNSNQGTGGLVGRAHNNPSNSIVTSFSIGTADSTTGIQNEGGLLGIDSSPSPITDTNNYWNTETSGLSSSDAGSGLTTTQMMAETNFSGFDFTNTWGIIEGESFPYLQVFHSSTPRAISGTSNLGSEQTVQLAVNGTNFTGTNTEQSTTQTGSDGFYYFLQPNAAISNSAVIMTYATSGTDANAITIAPSSGGSIEGLTLTGSALNLGDANTNTISTANIDTSEGSLSTGLVFTSTASTLTLDASTSLNSTTNTTYSMTSGDSIITSGIGAITLAGPVSAAGTSSFIAANGAITLTNSSNDFTGAVSLSNSGTNDVSLTNNRALIIGPSTIGRNLSLTSNGAMSQTGIISAADASTVTFANSGSSASIIIDSYANNFGSAAITFSGSVVDAYLRNTSSSAIFPSGMSRRNVVVTFNNAAITVPTFSTSGSLALSSGGDITQTGALTVAGTFILNSGSNDITLTNTGNLFSTSSGNTNVTGNNVSLYNDKNMEFVFANIAGNFDVQADGNITGRIASVGGTTTLNAGNNAISISGGTKSVSMTGAVFLTTTGSNNASIYTDTALNLGTSSIGQNLTIVTSNDAITQSGALTVAGSANFSAGSNSITLTNNSNAVTGDITLTNSGSNNVSFTNSLATNFAASTIGQNLAVITSSNAITQSGAFTVAGTSSFNAGAAAITLTNNSNAFTGAVSITNSGSNNVSLTNNAALIIDTSIIGQNLTLIANGNLTQTGAITATDASSIIVTQNSSSSDILLNTQANDFGSTAVTIGNAGSFTRGFGLRNTSSSAILPGNLTSPEFNNLILQFDNAAIELPAMLVTGPISITAGGAITQTGPLTATTASFSAGANPITLTQSNNSFNSTVTLSNSGSNNVSLTSALALTFGMTTIGGDLTIITSNDDITQTGGISVGGTSNFNTGAANITLNDNSNAFTGTLTLTNTGSNNVSITDSTATNLATSSVGNNLTVVSSGGITLSGILTAGGDITLSGATFINNAGANALNPGSSNRFLVWSTTPTNDSRGGISHTFKQYAATYGVTTPIVSTATSDGFLYSTTPSITPVLTGSVVKTYDGTTSAILSSENYTLTGNIDNDTITFNNATSGTYSTKNTGSGISVTATGISFASTNNDVTVYGYNLGSSEATASIGEINPIALTISNVTVDNKKFNSSTTATLNFTNAIINGILTGENVNISGFSADFSVATSGKNIPVTINSLGLSGTDANNYTIALPTGLSGNINNAEITSVLTSAAPTITTNNSAPNTTSSSSNDSSNSSSDSNDGSSSSGSSDSNDSSESSEESSEEESEETTSTATTTTLADSNTIQSIDDILSEQGNIDTTQMKNQKFKACQ